MDTAARILTVPDQGFVGGGAIQCILVKDLSRFGRDYINPVTPYGYKKDPEDKHRLIPDSATADVVRRIFTIMMACQLKMLP